MNIHRKFKKVLSVMGVVAFMPLSSFAGVLHCTSNLTTPSTPLEVTVLKEEIRNFRNDTRFVREIPNTDFSYAITTGLSQDIMDDPEVPTHLGVPTLFSLVVYNTSKSQVSRVDTPMTVAAHSMNLTIGSEAEGSKYRIHISCVLR